MNVNFKRITLATAIAATLSACAVGPDYKRPAVETPDHFKEGVEWQRAEPKTDLALHDNWWRDYQDDVLNGLVDQALKANQSIAEAEAAYRVAEAAVRSNTSAYFPTVSASFSGARTGTGAAVPLQAGGSTTGAAAIRNSVSLGATASWEPDLWGSVRRSVEASRANAQATDAQLAGVRLSITSNLVIYYFALRQADADIASLEGQRDIYASILKMTEAGLREGAASNDELLAAHDALDSAEAALRAMQTVREQDEHAIAVLIGKPPAAFSLEPKADYAFAVPTIPSALPSQLLLRRYDIVSAERTAAAANARIGVAKATYFPDLSLSASDGFAGSSMANLLTLPHRIWSVGPALAETLFDGGARSAAVESARANYDAEVAAYRNTVLSAFQSVEDSLSSMNHLGEQSAAQTRILRRSEQLYASSSAQFEAGAASQQDLLSAKLSLLQAQQQYMDVQAALSQSSVTLIKNLGGGAQWSQEGAPVAAADAK